METFYGGLKNSKGELIFSGPGASATRCRRSRARSDGPNGGGFDSVRILGFQNADYDWQQFDLDRDMPIIDAAAGFVDAVDPDLREFKAHGGKLLLYAGWRDTGITPENTVLYYESVREEMGPSRTTGCGCSWCPAWGIAAAARASTRSTRSPRSSNGASATSRRTQMLGYGPGVGSYAADLRRTRRTRSTTARAISKTPRTGAARRE